MPASKNTAKKAEPKKAEPKKRKKDPELVHAEQPATYPVTQEIDGDEHEFIVTPGHVDPVLLRPSKRDTLEKDRLAHEATSE